MNIFIEDQRLVILRVLVQANNDANESIIQDCLAVYGHKISRDAVRTHLSWLNEQGLLKINDVGGLFVAHITRRGYDVAEGLSVVPGVKKPRPE